MIQGYGSNKFTGSNPNMLPDGLGDFLLEQDYIRDKAWLWDRVGALMADMFNGGVAAGLLLLGGVCTDSGTHQSVNITAGYGYAPFTLNLGTSNALPPTTATEDLSPVRVAWGALTAQGVINVFSNATWYVVMQYAETDWLSRLRAKAVGTWAFGKQPSYTLTVTQSAPTAYQILLATIVTGATSGVAWTSITPRQPAAIPPPIGFVYTRYPGEATPDILFPGTTWSNISSNFPAAFFRAEGGAAATFQGTLGAAQAAQNLSHTHGSPITSGAGSSHAHAVGSLTIGGEAAHTHGPGTGVTFATNASTGGFLASGGTYGSCVATGAGSSHTHGISGSVGAESAHNHVVTVASDGGADLRPINYTIQIYKRTV